jgi:hypothetical protein
VAQASNDKKLINKPLRDLKLLVEVVDIKVGFGFRGLRKNN